LSNLDAEGGLIGQVTDQREGLPDEVTAQDPLDLETVNVNNEAS
jgi:hypothetical protein